MENIILPVSGNLRSQERESMPDFYKALCSKQWKNKAIWESIRDNELTAVPCFVGSQYSHEDIKIMIVGRAVNGWEVDFEDCSSLDNTVNSILKQENRLDDFAKDYILYDAVENNEVVQKKYYYAKSPFLRMMRQLVGALSNSEDNWQQRIVWSNLFKIAPRKGGNPSWLMLRDNLDLYIELMRYEIAKYRPDIVVFVTDMDFFDPYPNNEKYPSFRRLMKEEPCDNDAKFVKLQGSMFCDSSTKIIVTARPERRPIKDMIEEIYKTYFSMLKQELQS